MRACLKYNGPCPLVLPVFSSVPSPKDPAQVAIVELYPRLDREGERGDGNDSGRAISTLLSFPGGPPLGFPIILVQQY